MADTPRISAQETRENVLSGKAMLICAYPDDSKFTQYHLDGAISLSSFKEKVGELAKDQELIFY